MKYDIYFHNDFDGRAASAVMLAFLRGRGDDIEHFVPVKYDIIPQWLDENFLMKHKLFKGKHNPAIIVDFPFHPQATFWFDHHLRPFRNPAWGRKYKTDKFRRYDDSYRSACGLTYDWLKKSFGWKPPVHLKELVKWLNVIDFADYKSPRQTIEMKEPAIQLNTLIENSSDNQKETEKLIHLLSTTTISKIVQAKDMKRKINHLRRMMAQSIEFHKKNDRLIGRVIVTDISKDTSNDIAYFAPYSLHPKMLYSVRYNPHPGYQTLYHVNVAVNPWRRAENKKHIGELLQKYGGGGHKDVGGVEIQGKDKAFAAVDDFIKFLNAK